MGMDRLIHPALEGKPVAWFAPNYRLLSEVWRELQSILEPLIIRINQQDRRIELVGGGVIEMWSLDSPDSGRGRAYATVVIDEAAMVPDLEEAWRSIRPMLTDLIGTAWFLSTPRGLNTFKMFFDRGQDPERPEWASWQMPTTENPYMEATEIDSARRDFTELSFNQEYLAMFVDWEGSVFRRVAEAATVMPGERPTEGHEYVIGCDWGRSNDYTVFVVLDTTARAVVAMDRSNRVDYVVQRERLKALAECWRPQQIIAEQNSIGQPIIEQLNREELPIRAFTTTNASKAQAIEALALAFERGDIHILNDPVLLAELAAYQGETTPSGLIRYGAAPGQHDDTVMALALAWTAVSGRHRVIYPISDKDIVVADFDIPEHWPRAFAMDIRWTKMGVIWGALNPSSDTVYLYCEYLADADSAIHAAAIRSRGEWIPGLVDPAARGRKPNDGYQLIEKYRQMGRLRLEGVRNPAESGILSIHERMSSGRLKVFASLPKYLEERRVYRRDERDQIVEEHDHLQDAARCLINNISQMRPKHVPQRRDFQPPPGGDLGWMSL